MQKTLHTQGVLLLIAINLVWGTTFPLIKDAVSNLSPAVLIAIRFTVATLAFAPFARDLNARLVNDGVVLGLLLVAAFTSQAIGIETISANRAAFITSLNVILVPLFKPLFGQCVSITALLAAGLALSGIGLMSWESGALCVGDFWMLGCALSYAVYVLRLEATTLHHPPLTLATVQLSVVAVLGTFWAAPQLSEQIEAINRNFSALIYLGLVATAITTWSQTLVQRWVSAHETALLCALEPVFAAVFSLWLLGEKLGVRGLAGAGLVIAAMILSLSLRRVDKI